MKILGTKLFHGRNIYNHKPVAKITVDIGRFSDIPTNEIKNFNDTLLYHFPGLSKHTCSLGYEGGFVERLQRGTYLGHVLEHVILEVQNQFGYDVKYGKTLEEDNDVFNVFVEFENPDFVKACATYSAKILNNIIWNDYVDTEKMFSSLLELQFDTDLGLSTKAIYAEAKRRNIPVQRVGGQNLLQLGYGNKTRLIQATLLDSTSCISTDIASDKNLTKQVLSDLNIPVPQGYVVSSAQDAFDCALEIDQPVVIKPLNSNQGKGVRTNLFYKTEILSAFDNASQYSKKVIVEKHISGQDYRVLVVGNKVSAVAKRIPAKVVGNGKNTVKQLIEEENRNTLRGFGHEKPLTKIAINNKTHEVLQLQNLTINSIPKSDQEVFLCDNCNLSTGGTAEDFTDRIHPSNAELAIKAARALGIDVAGVDFVVQDISKPISQNNEGAIIEVNACPGIRMHLYPTVGKPQNVASDILNLIYPNQASANFPIISVTGTNGKTTVARLISHVLQLYYNYVGTTSTHGTYINNTLIYEGDNSGAESARQLLCNKNIDAAVLETARGGIIRRGLGYDLADVGIITNIAEDHLGANNINTLQELSHVKSLVAEAIKPNGFVVLNAEDESTKDIKNKVYENIIYFYLNENNIKVNTKDSICTYLSDNNIVIKDKNKLIKVINIESVPLTLGGVIECNILNCLTAVGALYALNIPLATIKKGLQSFKNNSGRFEYFHLNNFNVVLDYAHNYNGFDELLKVCKKLNAKRLVGIVGMPGDRMNEDYKKVAQLCAQNFNYIYLKEDKEQRERKQGEVSEIFLKEILSKQFSKNNVANIGCEKEALLSAIKNHEQGDLIVVTYENLEPLTEIINNYIKQS